MNAPANPGRRRFFGAAGAGLAAALPAAAPAPAEAARPTYVFFSPAEGRFVEAAVVRLIPKDEAGPGALEAGVPAYLDRQLAGGWGAGERLYRAGPWQPGTPSQGYQLPFTPAELFRKALRGIEDDLKKQGKSFATLGPQEQDAYLDSLQKEKKDLDGVPSNVFFESLLESTIEGFFSDPVYGGNRGKAAWKMIGFPGAYANFYELVGQNVVFEPPPIGLAEDAHGAIHAHAMIGRKK